MSAKKGAGEREVPIDGTGRVVIVAEHSARLRHKLADDLERYGFTVFEAADGEHALQLGKHLDAPVDLVIADRELEAISGPELAEELAAAGKRPRMLLLSHDDVDGDGDGAGDMPSIHLPVGRAELVRRVSEVLEDTREG